MSTTDYCECDNTHEQNNTICQFCWEQLEQRGFNPMDAPYMPIKKEWHCFPIVKALIEIRSQ